MGRPKAKRPAFGLETLDVPQRFLDVIDRRTLKFLGAIHLGDYDIRMLLRSAYTQGLCDAMQLAVDRPNTFDAIVLGKAEEEHADADK